MQVSKAITLLSQSKRANKPGIPNKDVLSLTNGDPDFDTPDHIRDAAIAAIREGHTHYTSQIGEADLRDAIARHVSGLGGGKFTADDILVTAGATSGLYATMKAYLDVGDEVLIHDPSFSLYADIARSIGAVPVFVPWDEKLRLDMDALERAVSPRTRMLLLNNPVNPTGIVFTQAEVQDVADFVIRHNMLLLSDEAYDHLVFDGHTMTSAVQFEDLADRLILINTCSKTFAMTGWRLGYVAARNSLVQAPTMIHRTSVGFVNSISQRAALAAFTSQTDWQRYMLNEYTKRRDLMCGLVNDIPGLHCEKPEGTFYVFVRVEVEMPSTAFTEHCLKHGVAVRNGPEFGPNGEGYIRLTFAGKPEHFKLGLERLENAMRLL